MSIQSEITRINALKSKIKTALISWGLVQSSANLDDCATAIAGIDVHNNISAQITEGDTYTIPKGYHNGSGTVSGISGGGNYSLQSKQVTPNASQQSITADSGYYGLSDVVVGPIPSAYKDVSVTTAELSDVLSGKVIVQSDGAQGVGTMPNKGKVTATIDGLNTTSYAIPKGYHDGTGTVSLTNDIENALAEI